MPSSYTRRGRSPHWWPLAAIVGGLALGLTLLAGFRSVTATPAATATESPSLLAADATTEPVLAPIATLAPTPVATLVVSHLESDEDEPPLVLTPAPTSEPVVAPTATVTPTPGPPRIGLQVGHWKNEDLPEELSRLRGSTGGAGGGYREVDVNLLVAERLAERLIARGYLVDILPATVPPRYQADVFIAIHADANLSPGPRGFKLARGRWSRLPSTDDALVQVLTEEYGQATGLPWDNAITRNMTGYYAFNNRRREHAIAPTTPAAILEMGYLTNPIDRAFLVQQTDRVLDGIERGLVRFLDERPPLAERETPAAFASVVVINEGGATAHAAPSSDAPVLARLDGGLRQEAPDIQGEWYGIWVPQANGPGWVHRSEATLTQVPLP